MGLAAPFSSPRGPHPPTVTVDAHHHFWNPARIPQPWMTAEHAAIARTFEPGDLEPLLRAAGVTRTVLVQSAARDDDTDYMFDLASDVAWVGGIVAWCRLDDERRARARLDELLRRPKLRGIRHLIHQEPDPHWILQPAVEPALTLLEEAGCILELPAVFPTTSATFPSSRDAPRAHLVSTTSPSLRSAPRRWSRGQISCTPRPSKRMSTRRSPA